MITDLTIRALARRFIILQLFLRRCIASQPDNDVDQAAAVSQMEHTKDLLWWHGFNKSSLDETETKDEDARTMFWPGESQMNSVTNVTPGNEDIKSVNKNLATSVANFSVAAVTGFCRPSSETRENCRGSGTECSSHGACCSNQCIICKPNCQGRCGLGVRRPRDDIQIFYYPWYATLANDGSWRHWAIDARPEGGPYVPASRDLPANFYPRLGPYSSSSNEVLNMHMRWIARAGIGTIVVSWWGANSFEDRLMWKILDAADDWELKVAFYVESYAGGYVREDPETNTIVGTRTPRTAMRDVMYLIDTYGCHRAVYRRDGRPVFLFFAARTYKNGDQTEWKEVWEELHSNANYDPVVIAHDTNLERRIIAGGWDGGHDYGTRAAFSKSADWPSLAAMYASADKILYFTVSPGYDKTRLRGNNSAIIDREDGQLYKTFWMRAIAAKKTKNPVVITSFNEWHEGTNIEPAKPLTIPPYFYLGERRLGHTYDDYEGAWGLSGEAAAFSYIDYTRQYSMIYRSTKTSD